MSVEHFVRLFNLEYLDAHLLFVCVCVRIIITVSECMILKKIGIYFYTSRVCSYHTHYKIYTFTLVLARGCIYLVTGCEKWEDNGNLSQLKNVNFKFHSSNKISQAMGSFQMEVWVLNSSSIFYMLLLKKIDPQLNFQDSYLKI